MNVGPQQLKVLSVVKSFNCFYDLNSLSEPQNEVKEFININKEFQQ